MQLYYDENNNGDLPVIGDQKSLIKDKSLDPVTELQNFINDSNFNTKKKKKSLPRFVKP